MKTAILPAWMYRDPCEIADGLIARSARRQKEAERKAELHRKHKSRRIKSLVRLAKQGKLHG